jgi:hypothetical protein
MDFLPIHLKEYNIFCGIYYICYFRYENDRRRHDYDALEKAWSKVY